MKFRKAFGYAGGQRALLPHVINLIPAHKTFVELFAGGATIFFNKAPSEVEVINDIDNRLINLYNVLREHPEEFKRQISLMPNSRELFARFKREIIKETDEIKRAAMYYYLITNTWSGKTKAVGYVAKPHASKEMEWFANRLRHVIIENLDYKECLEKYDAPDVFVYADPPYVRGGPSLYEFSFEEKDHMEFADVMKRIAGKFLITYDDHPLIDILFKDYFKKRVETVKTMASKGVGEKCGRETHLLIANYDIINRRFRPFTAKYFTF